jgi:DNA-binding transcriptional LysR family regulator
MVIMAGEQGVMEDIVSPPSLPERQFARQVDWNLFKDFLELVRHGGIGAAARALGRRQPSMSATLKRLEAQIGCSLCERTSQGIALTPAGQAVAELCEQIAGHVLAMPSRAASATGMLEGMVGIGMISDVAAPVLEQAMFDFHAAHPRVQLKLNIMPWRSVVDAVARGMSEVGIACDNAPRDGLRYLPLVREAQQLYCGRASALFGAAPAPPSTFADELFVLTGEDEPDELGRFRRRFGLGARVSGTSETLQEARRLIDLGFGIGFLPVGVAIPHVRSGTLWPLLPEAMLPAYDVHVITRSDQPGGPPARLFVETVAQRLAALS